MYDACATCLNTPMKNVPEIISAWSLNDYKVTYNQFALYQIRFDLHHPNAHVDFDLSLGDLVLLLGSYHHC